MIGGAVEGTVAVTIGGVDVGVGVEEQPSDVDVAIPRRKDKGSITICACDAPCGTNRRSALLPTHVRTSKGMSEFDTHSARTMVLEVDVDLTRVN
jgi:hypothetical protein